MSRALSLAAHSRRLWFWFRLRGEPVFGLRIGIGSRFFSERYQGTRGIPRRFYYLTPWVTVILPRKGRA